MQHTFKKNRLVLKLIISAVEFCSHQGISLRGHQDYAKYLEDTDLNPGNYQALLESRCDAGDTVLAEHLSKCAKNATYHLKMTQNDIIDILGSKITEKVVARVNEAKSLLLFQVKSRMWLQSSRSLLY